MMTGMRNVPSSIDDATKVLSGGAMHVLRGNFLSFACNPTWGGTIMRLDEARLTSQAAAFSTCIMAIVSLMSLLLHYVTKKRRKLVQ